jgi:hypothetical protein
MSKPLPPKKYTHDTVQIGENGGTRSASPSGKLASVASDQLASIEDPDVKAAVNQFLQSPPSKSAFHDVERDLFVPFEGGDAFPPIKAVRDPAGATTEFALRESVRQDRFDSGSMSPEYERSPSSSPRRFMREGSPVFEEFPIGPSTDDVSPFDFPMTDAGEDGSLESKKPPRVPKKPRSKRTASPKARKSILKRPFAPIHF